MRDWGLTRLQKIVVKMIATESEEFINGVQEAISENSKIDRKLAHSMFVGPHGSGSSRVRSCMVNRLKKNSSLSTGVCNPIIIVDVDVDNPSTWPFCFRCNHCSELHEVKRGKIHKVYCNKTRKNTRLPLQGRFWFNVCMHNTV